MLQSSDLFTVDCFPLVCLSDASFLGKLLVLPANVRLDWKVIARYKHSSLFGLIISNEEKFYNIDTKAQSFKIFFLRQGKIWWNYFL